MTVTVLSAGLGKPSSTRLLADRLAAATASALDTEPPRVLELREHAHDLTNALLTGVPTGGLAELTGEVTGASGLIAVTPVFNASYSGLFKTFFDVLEPGALAGKPVLVAATGGSPRHSLVLEHAMRPLFSYLSSVVVPTGVYAATEDWGTASGLDERITRAAGELAGFVTRHTPRADPFDDPTPFERLLTGTER